MSGHKQRWVLGLMTVLAAGCGQRTTTRVRFLRPAEVGVQYREAGRTVEVLPAGAGDTGARPILRARIPGRGSLQAFVQRRNGTLTLRCDSGCGSAPLLNGSAPLTLVGRASENFPTLGGGSIPPLRRMTWLPGVPLGARLVRKSGASVSGAFVDLELTTTWDNIDEVAEVRSRLPWEMLGPGLGTFFAGLGVGLGGAMNGNTTLMGVGFGLLGVGGALIGWALGITHQRTVVYRREHR